MKKVLKVFLLTVCSITFFAPVSSALAKRKKCYAAIEIANNLGKYIKIRKIKTQRKGGTIFYRSTFFENSAGIKIEKKTSQKFTGTFKINKKYGCGNKRLWNIHYKISGSSFIKVARFYWIKGKKDGSRDRWSVMITAKKN